MKMNPENLEDLFRDLDRRYFAGLITTVYRIDWHNLDEPSKVESAAVPAVTAEPPSIPGGIRGICIPEARQILIDHCRNPEDQNRLRATVVHEMIHAAVEIERPLRRTDDPHGPRFTRVEAPCQGGRETSETTG